MKRLLLVAAATFITPVHAAGCDEETIRRVARGGSVVILDSGGVYEVAPADTGHGALECRRRRPGVRRRENDQ
jgi:hypothetical protein